jgi:hypothetical protein
LSFISDKYKYAPHYLSLTSNAIPNFHSLFIAQPSAVSDNMASGIGGNAGIGAVNDPRLHNDGRDQSTYPTRTLEKLHDPSIPIEEYIHYAKMTRSEEDRLYGPGSDYVASAGPATRFFKSKILRKQVEERQEVKPRLSISNRGEAQIGHPDNGDASSTEKLPKEKTFEPMVITDDEWVNASRAARTATWYVILPLAINTI